MERTTTGAAYIRVSTDEQTELSPDAQLRVILKQAQDDGITIPEEFIFIEKKGISGRKAENRPEFQRMIAIAKSQNESPFGRLYLWKFSRFARNQEESTFYKGILRKKCHVEIISISEPIMDGMFGRLIETIIEWFDEYYSYNLSGEVLRGMKEKALRNGYQLRPCLGYKALGGGRPYMVDEEEYKTVELIFSSYHSGMDMNQIARRLNTLGLHTKGGCLFDRRAVYRILTNHFYIGEVAWNGIKFQGEHETRQSVTSIFQDVQTHLLSQYHPVRQREASTNSHWLSGLLKCRSCKATLSFNRSKNNRTQSFFQCWKYAKGLHSGSCSIAAGRAEAAVIQSLYMITGENPEEYTCIKQSSSSRDAGSVSHALKRLENRELRLRKAYESGIDTLEEYRQNKERLLTERRLLLEQQKALFSDANCQEHCLDKSFSANTDGGNSGITACGLLLAENADAALKGNALRSIIKHIEYDRENDRIEVLYYISSDFL